MLITISWYFRANICDSVFLNGTLYIIYLFFLLFLKRRHFGSCIPLSCFLSISTFILLCHCCWCTINPEQLCKRFRVTGGNDTFNDCCKLLHRSYERKHPFLLFFATSTWKWVFGTGTDPRSNSTVSQQLSASGLYLLTDTKQQHACSTASWLASYVFHCF